MKATIQTKKGKAYDSFIKEFNNETHLNNWVRLMERKGVKIIGIIPQQDDDRSLSDYVSAQENAYFDNFCMNNNI